MSNRLAVTRTVRRWVHMMLLGLMIFQSLIPVGAQELAVEPPPHSEELVEEDTSQGDTLDPVTATEPDEPTDPPLDTDPPSEPPLEEQPVKSVEEAVGEPIGIMPSAYGKTSAKRQGTIRRVEPCLAVPRVYLPYLTKAANNRTEGGSDTSVVCLLDMNSNTELVFNLDHIVAPQEIITGSISLSPTHGTASLSDSTLHYTPTNNYIGKETIEIVSSNNTYIHIKILIEDGTATPVVPVISCTEAGTSNIINAKFGYLNYTTTVVERPIGSQNQFLNGAMDRGQPTTFQPGLTEQAFTVPFTNGTELDWVLDKRRLTIDSDLFPCSNGNTVPVVTPAELSVEANSTASLDLATYAEDADNDALTWALATNPSHGNASIISSTLWYTPTPDYHGTDELTYTVNDSTATVTGTVAISVTNAAPIVTLQASPESGPVPLTVAFTATASDPDGDDTALTYEWVFGDGTESSDLISTTHVYTTDGIYTSAVIVTDADGVQSSASIQIEVGQVGNNAPVASDETLYLTDSLTTGIDLALTSYDLDGDVLTWSITQDPQYGTAIIDGSVLTYTRTQAFTGSDFLIYEVSDAISSTTAMIRIVDQRIIIQISPAQVLLPGINMTHTLEAKGYDFAGNEVPLTGMELDWLVSHSNWITGTSSLTFTTVPGNPQQISEYCRSGGCNLCSTEPQ